MQMVSKQTFIGRHILIDNKHFVDCTLCDCVLEYGGGDLILERTQITRCKHVFSGHAQRTISYLEVAGLLGECTEKWQLEPAVLQ